MKSVVTGAVTGAMLMLTGPVWAQGRGFDPNKSCARQLSQMRQDEQLQMGAWVAGYLAAMQIEAKPVTLISLAGMTGDLAQICSNTPDKSLLQIMASLTKTAPEHTMSDAESIKAQARRLLMQFYDRNADLAALTLSLKPTAQDIHAVYRAPLASKLVAQYEAIFNDKARIAPKPHHDDLLIYAGRTSELRAGGPLLHEFPGGYREVVEYITGDVPIVRFKFITSGETLGLAFDGLIHVNGRWVLMPKPWRALD